MHTGHSPPKTFLLEGPLCALIEARRDLIERMAKDLVALGALGSDREAVMALTGRYKAYDVAILAGEARMVAYQEIVGQEMGDS
jgi:hypothetical protein